MADIFVKVGGNNANNGSTWALAKADVYNGSNGGLDAVSSAGDRVIVAPGNYYNKNLVPAVAGGSGNPCYLIGDVGGTYADGGSNYHGVTPGYVVVDGTLQAGNYGWDTANNVLTQSASWNFWSFVNVWFTGGDGNLIGHPTSGNITFTATGCMFQGNHSGLTVRYTNSGAGAIALNNCVFQCFSLDDISRAGLILYEKDGSFPATPQVTVTRSVIIGSATGVYMNGTDSSMYTYAGFVNCTIMNIRQEGTWYPVDGVNATYNKVDLTDCLIHGLGRNGAGVTIGTETRTASYYNGNASTLTKFPFLPNFPFLYPGSPVINANSSNGSFPDIWGTAIQGNADYGAQEYVTGQYPLVPNMDISSLQTGAQGTSGVSRSRIVNAGGI